MVKVDYWLSTTIKKVWMDKILSGEKKKELKADTIFWFNRILSARNKMYDNKVIGINFLCGQKSYKYLVTDIRYYHFVDNPKDIDGTLHDAWWEIQIGVEIKEEDKCRE